jgi:hypothetical protein
MSVIPCDDLCASTRGVASSLLMPFLLLTKTFRVCGRSGRLARSMGSLWGARMRCRASPQVRSMYLRCPVSWNTQTPGSLRCRHATLFTLHTLSRTNVTPSTCSIVRPEQVPCPIMTRQCPLSFCTKWSTMKNATWQHSRLLPPLRTRSFRIRSNLYRELYLSCRCSVQSTDLIEPAVGKHLGV